MEKWVRFGLALMVAGCNSIGQFGLEKRMNHHRGLAPHLMAQLHLSGASVLTPSPIILLPTVQSFLSFHSGEPKNGY